MKGFADEPTYIIELLEEGVTLDNVIDEHIYEQALNEKNAFLVGDLGVLMKQHILWRSTIPELRPYFPVKCNSSPAVIEILVSLGLGFVCSNKAEVSLVLDHGVSPENIILSGVCKQLVHIKHAAKNGIDHLVCDSETELCKIARSHPSAKLLLQVTTAAHATEHSMAFGCTLKSCHHLLKAAKELGVQVVGVTFHIPPACKDLKAYAHALLDARCVFDMGTDLGFKMTMLEIGGGFTGSELQLRQIESAIRPLLDTYFPPLSGVEVMAEAGSFYVSSAFTLAVNVIGKKIMVQDWNSLPIDGLSSSNKPEFQYCMNEGVYGSFGIKLLGNTIPAPSVHKRPLNAEEPVFPSSLWGPSCDPLEQVVEHCLLPELVLGEWLVFNNMGASGLEELNAFNSDISRPPVYYTITMCDWYKMRNAGVSLDSAMKNFSLVQYGV